jgi:lysyl-tRNA synthetase class 2
MDRSTWLDMIMSTIVAPRFAQDQLTVVRHYPAEQAALARLCHEDERVADRFEVFCGDLELANGYVELSDAAEQQLRIDRDLDIRQAAGRAQSPSDPRLISALEQPLPECAGVAVGVERLHMILDQIDDIADVVTFVAEAP